MKMVCVKCQKAMHLDRAGVVVLVEADFGPYQLFRADEYKCDGCLTVVVSGFANSPLAEHFQPDFKEQLAAHEIVARIR